MGKRQVLHIGNILNNAYLTCKFLRRKGFEADALTVDYRHVQGQPEWEEVRLDEKIADEFEPDWNAVNLKGFRRPDWFFDVKTVELSYLAERLVVDQYWSSDRSPLADSPHSPPFLPQAQALKMIGYKLADLLGAQRLVARLRCHYLSKNPNYKLLEQQSLPLIDEFKRTYPEFATSLTRDDICSFLPISCHYTSLLRMYPLVQAYSLHPIFVMLANPGQPFICFEHGTMREFPFEDSARGRLYALSLKKAERVIITNADCNLAAERLGLNNYTFIPHPVDEQKYYPEPSPIRQQLLEEHGSDYVFVAPARHHWKNCPPGLENSWFKRNDILIRALGQYFRAYPQLKVVVVFFEWGQEVELSKQLIEECGFADRVRWEPIRSKPYMKDYYNAADVVFDQFNGGIGTFGTVVPEALACAKPVIINYKEELHHWCFPDLPPLLHAACEEEIVAWLEKLIGNPEWRAEQGKRGRTWFEQNHSSQVVAERTLDIYREISDKHSWGWTF